MIPKQHSMKISQKIIVCLILYVSFAFINSDINKNILTHEVNLKKANLQFYSTKKNGRPFKNFKNLQKYLRKKSEKLVFAMNGGIYKPNWSPKGLYIENGKVESKIDTITKGYGNFYLQPNGIFYITYDNEGFVCATNKFKNENVKFATQSGPLLVIDNQINNKFIKGSKNLHIRNGVGILPNGNVLFAMSLKPISFYDFANFFKSSGCKNALYLDGFVSKTYLPAKGFNNLGGNFGIIIAQTEK